MKLHGWRPLDSLPGTNSQWQYPIKTDSNSSRQNRSAGHPERDRQADVAAVAELQRVVRGRSFDEEPLPELNSEAIDFRDASERFGPGRGNRKLAHTFLHLPC